MLITRVSPLTHKKHQKEINVTQDQINKWQSGALIQDAMPNLTAGEREFIKTGITDEELEALFGKS